MFYYAKYTSSTSLAFHIVVLYVAASRLALIASLFICLAKGVVFSSLELQFGIYLMIMPGAQDLRNKLCLLSLDGGGVRGLSSLMILRAVMERVNQGRKDSTRLRPCQILDVIGGTSTGGLAIPCLV